MYPLSVSVICLGLSSPSAKIDILKFSGSFKLSISWENIIVVKNENIKYTVNGKNLIGGILNITFHDILSQDLVIALDMKGYAISGGSACSSGSVKTSTTLQQIKMDKNLAQRTVRISFGKNLTEDDIDGLSKAIISIINKSTLNAK